MKTTTLRSLGHPTSPRILLVALLATAALFAFASNAQASTSQLSVFQDDGHLLSPDPASRQAALDKIQSLGADAVKISVLWRASSPNFMSHSRPGGDTASPDYYDWGIAPTVISEIQARGMVPWVMVTEVGPDWAEANGASKAQPGGLKPDPELFGDFAVAAYKRFGDVPFFQVGNEPNFQLWLWPQITKKKVSYSAVQYRKMYLAAQQRILAVGLGGRQLLFGALAPRAEKPSNGQRATQPVRFLRDFFCLDDKLRRLKGSAARARECSGAFEPIRATGFAYHPYTDKFGPRAKPEQADDAPIGYMKRIYKVLDRASSFKRLAVKRIPVWNDEFAFESNPPDLRRTPISKIPQYLNESEYLSYKDSRLKSYAQYQLIDEPLPDDPAAPFGRFQSGLYFADGDAKGGVLTAYRMPMVAIKARQPNRATIWFGVRNLRNIDSRLAVVQFRRGSSGKWKTVANVTRFTAGRYAQVNVRANGAAKGQFRVVCGDYSSRTTGVVPALNAKG